MPTGRPLSVPSRGLKVIRRNTSAFDIMNLFYNGRISDEEKIRRAINMNYVIPPDFVQLARQMYLDGTMGCGDKLYSISQMYHDPEMRQLKNACNFEHNPKYAREYPRRRMPKGGFGENASAEINENFLQDVMDIEIFYNENEEKVTRFPHPLVQGEFIEFYGEDMDIKRRRKPRSLSVPPNPLDEIEKAADKLGEPPWEKRTNENGSIYYVVDGVEFTQSQIDGRVPLEDSFFEAQLKDEQMRQEEEEARRHLQEKPVVAVPTPIPIQRPKSPGPSTSKPLSRILCSADVETPPKLNRRWERGDAVKTSLADIALLQSAPPRVVEANRARATRNLMNLSFRERKPDVVKSVLNFEDDVTEQPKEKEGLAGTFLHSMKTNRPLEDQILDTYFIEDSPFKIDTVEVTVSFDNRSDSRLPLQPSKKIVLCHAKNATAKPDIDLFNRCQAVVGDQLPIRKESERQDRDGWMSSSSSSSSSKGNQFDDRRLSAAPRTIAPDQWASNQRYPPHKELTIQIGDSLGDSSHASSTNATNSVKDSPSPFAFEDDCPDDNDSAWADMVNGAEALLEFGRKPPAMIMKVPEATSKQCRPAVVSAPKKKRPKSRKSKPASPVESAWHRFSEMGLSPRLVTYDDILCARKRQATGGRPAAKRVCGEVPRTTEEKKLKKKKKTKRRRSAKSHSDGLQRGNSGDTGPADMLSFVQTQSRMVIAQLSQRRVESRTVRDVNEYGSSPASFACVTPIRVPEDVEPTTIPLEEYVDFDIEQPYYSDNSNQPPESPGDFEGSGKTCFDLTPPMTEATFLFGRPQVHTSPNMRRSAEVCGEILHGAEIGIGSYGQKHRFSVPAPIQPEDLEQRLRKLRRRAPVDVDSETETIADESEGQELLLLDLESISDRSTPLSGESYTPLGTRDQSTTPGPDGENLDESEAERFRRRKRRYLRPYSANKRNKTSFDEDDRVKSELRDSRASSIASASVERTRSPSLVDPDDSEFVQMPPTTSQELEPIPEEPLVEAEDDEEEFVDDDEAGEEEPVELGEVEQPEPEEEEGEEEEEAPAPEAEVVEPVVEPPREKTKSKSKSKSKGKGKKPKRKRTKTSHLQREQSSIPVVQLEDEDIKPPLEELNQPLPKPVEPTPTQPKKATTSVVNDGDDDDIIFIPQPKEEPLDPDEVQVMELPKALKFCAAREKDTPFPAPQVTDSFDPKVIHEYLFRKPYHEVINRLFVVDPSVFSRVVYQIIIDTNKEGLVYRSNVEPKNRTNPFTDELFEVILSSEKDSVYYDVKWKNYSIYSHEFRHRLAMATVFFEGVSPAAFQRVFEHTTNCAERLIGCLRPAPTANEMEFIRRVEQSIHCRIAATSLEMASISSLEWASEDHVRRRFKVLEHGWVEFLRKGGFLKVLDRYLQLDAGHTPVTETFKTTLDDLRTTNEKGLALAVSILKRDPATMLQRILEEADVSQVEYEILCNGFSPVADSARFPRSCNCFDAKWFFTEEAYHIHERCMHPRNECEVCYEETPSMTLLILHELVMHYGMPIAP